MPNIPAWSDRCTVQLRDGDFCDVAAMSDAPFPICARHIRKAYQFGRDLVEGVTDQTMTLDILTRWVAYGRTTTHFDPPPLESVVYYLQVGDAIKIGFSTNLKQRLKTYPPTRKLLAVEPGSMNLEGRRHREFRADLVAGNEWFRPSDALLAHIADLA